MTFRDVMVIELSNWYFIFALLGNVTGFNSESAGMLLSSCSTLEVSSFRAVSTFPEDGVQEEHAESSDSGDIFLFC